MLGGFRAAIFVPPTSTATPARAAVIRGKLVRKLIAESKDTEGARRLLAAYEELLQILVQEVIAGRAK